MEQKMFLDSPNFKNLKRSIFDCRVDSLLPNTLYLLNLRSNYSKKRISNSIEFKFDDNCDFNDDLEVDKEPLSQEKSSIDDNTTSTNRENGYNDSNNNTNNNSTICNNKNKLFNNVNYIKSHICFLGIEYYCLKYDHSNFTNGVYYTKESPEHNSYIVSNIFLRKDPELKLDQDSLFDASWEVESIHICKRILSFIKYNLCDNKNKYNTNSNTEHIDLNNTNNNSSNNNIVKDVRNNNTNNNSNNNSSNTNYRSNNINDNKDSNNDSNNNTSYNNTLRNLRRLEDIRVLDGFCGIGGNLVHFANNFRYSLGVELNPERVEMCKNNLRVYGVSDNCDVLNDNILNFCEEYLKDPEHYFKHVLKRPEMYREGEIKQFDWVFLSFPWGGINYKGARDSEIYYLTEYFTEFYKVVKYASMIGHNVTMNLPRSQSLLELVKSAFMLDFNYILVDCYLVYPSYHKIRCCTIHFLNNASSFNNNININNVVKINNSKMFFNKLQLISDSNSNRENGDNINSNNISNNLCDIKKDNTNTNSNDSNDSHPLDTLNLININYYIDKFNYLNFINIGLLILLNEHNPNVYKKLTALFSLLPLNDVIQLVNDSIELYYSSNRPITVSGNERTLGGTFFYLLKLKYNNIYKIIEKKHKIVK